MGVCRTTNDFGAGQFGDADSVDSILAGICVHQFSVTNLSRLLSVWRWSLPQKNRMTYEQQKQATNALFPLAALLKSKKTEKRWAIEFIHYVCYNVILTFSVMHAKTNKLYNQCKKRNCHQKKGEGESLLSSRSYDWPNLLLLLMNEWLCPRPR